MDRGEKLLEEERKRGKETVANYNSEEEKKAYMEGYGDAVRFLTTSNEILDHPIHSKFDIDTWDLD